MSAGSRWEPVAGSVVWQSGRTRNAAWGAGTATAQRTEAADPLAASRGQAVTAAAAAIDRILSGMEDLSTRDSASAVVLATVDRPDSDAGDVAGAVSADPGLSGRLLRLSNSAFYGLSGRVSSVRFAVTAVGFSTVRAMAVSCASGIAGDAKVPDGYWEHACAHGVAAGLIATAVGAKSPDAFCAGLLSNIGEALLSRADADGFALVLAAGAGDAAAQLAAERDVFGVTHPEVSARLLSAWHLPQPMVDAVSHHHALPTDGADPLVLAVRAGEEVARRVSGLPSRLSLRQLTRGRVGDDALLVEQVRDQSAGMLAAFTTA